jgi:hypothetical protein
MVKYVDNCVVVGQKACVVTDLCVWKGNVGCVGVDGKKDVVEISKSSIGWIIAFIGFLFKF